LFDIQLYFDIF
jgi:NADPH:quinone reductase-like Zn-dependent oxidoreductase